MALPPFPRGCKHDFRFAGLLTYSGRFRLPTRQRFPGSARFPFHPQVRIGTWSEQNCRKDRNYFLDRKGKEYFLGKN